MKTLLTFIYLFFLTFLTFAKSPDGFSYQAIVRDAVGNLKKNQSVSIIFEIIDASSSVKYTESHTATTNDYGLVNLVIGQGATSDDFSAIDWGNGTYSVNVNIDGTDMGTSQLWSVPYAISASNGITQAQADSITANTAKTGITTVQADAITANTTKTGITTVQADAITANTAKTGITTVQVDAITANTAKSGITTVQVDAITANTTKVSGATATEIGYLSGVTSAIQTQLDAKGTASLDDIIPGYRVTLGSNAGSSTTGGYSVSIGRNANKNWAGSYNTAVGSFALETITSGSYNQAFGAYALGDRTSGAYGTAIGAFALEKVTTGSRNTALGNFAGNLITTGGYNVLLGDDADVSANNASNQIVIGYSATGQGNNYAVIGDANITRLYAAEDAGATLYAGGLNLGGTAITADATEMNYLDGVTSSIQTQLDAKSTGAHTVDTNTQLTESQVDAMVSDNGYGTASLDDIIPGYRVTLGSNAGSNTTGGYSVSIGRNANKNWDGSYNTTVGSFALETITTGSYNQAFGAYALNDRTSGAYATAIGAFALEKLTTGSRNTALGNFAGNLITTGGQNVLLGDDADVSANNASNQIVIGFGATGQANNSVTLGNANVTRVYAAEDGDAVLYANGTINTSDARLKENIKSLTHGLDFIMNLNPVSYVKMKLKDFLNSSSEESENKKFEIGLLAQEVEEASENLGFENKIVSVGEDGIYRMDYSKIIMPLVKAIQEQQEIIEELKERLNHIEGNID